MYNGDKLKIRTSVGFSLYGLYFVKEWETALETVELVAHPDQAFVFTYEHAQEELSNNKKYYETEVFDKVRTVSFYAMFDGVAERNPQVIS